MNNFFAFAISFLIVFAGSAQARNASELANIASEKKLDCNRIYTDFPGLQDVLRLRGYMPVIKKKNANTYDYQMGADVKLDRLCTPNEITPAMPTWYNKDQNSQICEFRLYVTTFLADVISPDKGPRPVGKKPTWLDRQLGKKAPPESNPIEYPAPINYSESRSSPNRFLNPRKDPVEIAQLSKDVDQLLVGISNKILDLYCDPSKAAPGPIPPPVSPAKPGEGQGGSGGGASPDASDGANPVPNEPADDASLGE